MDYKTVIKISEKMNEAFASDLETQHDWVEFKNAYPNIAGVLTFVNEEEDKFYGKKVAH